MRKIYSKKEPLMLLHIVNSKKDVTDERQDLSPEIQFLQVSCAKLNTGQIFPAHKHVVYTRLTTITQESLIVISGEVKAILYDVDDTILEEVVLKPGDCSITYLGGHSYESLKEGTIVYQFKTGPYFGKAKDRTLIKEKENDG